MPAPTTHGFSEKVALIANGADGVGRATALQLALLGCYVIVGCSGITDNDRNALNELKSLGTLAHFIEEEEPLKLVEAAVGIFGRIEFLVNCVKSEQDSTFQIETLANSAASHLNERPRPAIVNVVSSPEAVHFVDGLPTRIRQNCVVSDSKPQEMEGGFFTVNSFDSTARVVLFFLSGDAKSLNRQTLRVG
jgi:hypothetical protein